MSLGLHLVTLFSAGHSAASNFPTASKIERMVKKAFL